MYFINGFLFAIGLFMAPLFIVMAIRSMKRKPKITIPLMVIYLKKLEENEEYEECIEVSNIIWLMRLDKDTPEHFSKYKVNSKVKFIENPDRAIGYDIKLSKWVSRA